MAEPVATGPGAVRVALRQVGYQNRLVLRSPTGPFFTLVIPLMVLIALNLVYGNQTIHARGVRFPRFYTPAMAAFAITNACYVNVLTGVTLSRDEGMLKRFRGTPLPTWAYFFGRTVSAGLVAVLSAGVVLLMGTSMYPVTFPWRAVGPLVLATLAGVVCFSMLGLAVSAFVPTAGAALPVAYGTLLPLSFISDVFFPMDTSPHWLRTAASALPLRPLARSLEAPFLSGNAGVHWAELAVVGGWAVAGAALVAVCFPWERSGSGIRARRAR
ncbi:MAG TPA: ABC transporter permease [Acidimicrobiales bacterium]|nr:ABC transporter permease [Acidimicrobiales bacterium]